MRVIRLDTEHVNTLFTTDWHLSDIPPGRRIAGYRERILKKIEFCRDVAHQYGAVGLFGGDMFHSKSNRALGNTFSLLTRLENALRSYPLGTMFGREGNHDLWMDRQDSIPNQPIGSLIASGALTNVVNESIIFENRDGSVRVQVDAFPYADDLVALDMVLNAPPREPGVQYRVVLMHQYGAPGNDPTMHGSPIIGYNRMADCDYDVALWGHDHSREDKVTVGNCTHVRLGSLARAALSMDEVDRPVAAALLSFRESGMAFKEIAVPVEPLEVAFVAADDKVDKVHKSEEVLEFFREMDLAVGTIESTDPLTVMHEVLLQQDGSTELSAANRRVFDRAVGYCEL